MTDPVGQAVAAAEHADAETRYRLQLAREMFEAGRIAGFDAGYRQAAAEMDERWERIARPLATGPTHAELENRRWGPGGREHFADPRPGDFPGRGCQPLRHQPEKETEAEA